MSSQKSITLILLLFFLQACQSEDVFLNTTKTSITPVLNTKINSVNEVHLSFAINVEILNKRYHDFIVVESKYNLAFVDLIKFKEEWYIVFRISDDHVAKEFGHIIICKSKDLSNWEFEQEFTQKNYDLRDPKFIIKNETLYTYFHSTSIKPYGRIRNDYISRYDSKNKTWDNAIQINKNTQAKSWFWRLTEHQDTIYSMAYLSGVPLKLYKSTNIIDFDESNPLNISKQVSETTLRFKEDTAITLMRQQNGGALLGFSSLGNLSNWDLKTMPWVNMGGPNFLIYNNYLLITGRVNGKTTLYSYSLSNENLKEIMKLPGGMKETGYAGMYIENDILYLSYYTGIENGFAIMFTIVELNSVL